MALSNWDTLAFDIDGPSHFGSVVNHEQTVVSLYKNWLNVTRMVRSISGPPWRRHDKVTEEYVATVNHGELHVGAWTIHARRGPQNGIYVIATSARWNQHEPVERAFLVGCGVSGYTDPTESYQGAAIDLGVDPDTLMTSAGEDGEDGWSIVGFRIGSPEFVSVAVGVDVPEAEWVGVLPESVNYLKGFTQEYLRDDCIVDSWPSQELTKIPWDLAERCNQGDLFFEGALGTAAHTTAPGDATDPLLIQTLGKTDG
jgi:hypothetical protein